MDLGGPMECLSQKENPRNINGSEGDFCVEISAFQLINLIAYNFPYKHVTTQNRECTLDGFFPLCTS